MDHIRYLPAHDLARPLYLNQAKEVITQLKEGSFPIEINNIISLYNIIRYIDNGLEQHLDNPDRQSIQLVIGTFLNSKSPVEILEYFEKIDPWFQIDFWSFLTQFRIEKELKEEDFNAFLTKQRPSIGPILLQDKLQKKFQRSLRDYFLSNVNNVNFWIGQNEIKPAPSPKIPCSITNEDKLTLISSYIDSETPSFDSLEVLAKFKELPLRVRLAAQGRAEEVKAKVFRSAAPFNLGIEVLFREQEEVYRTEFKDNHEKHSYDLNWIKENSDEATLLNNFIYLFNYSDDQGRLNLCFQNSELGAFEGAIQAQRSDWHPTSMAFTQKNNTAFLQLYSYANLLKSLNTSIEQLINWFFRKYLEVEFEINNFQADIPEGDRPFLEKCKLLAPEIERVLKQFQLLVEDGQINHELIALDTSPFVITETSSFLKKKYCYLNSEDGKLAAHYFYSDQCMLLYDSKSQKSYKSFAERLVIQKPNKNNFEDYQIPELNWLEKHKYLRISNDGNVQISDIHKVVFLREIHHNGCLCYDEYNNEAKDTLDMMISEGTLRLGSSLFSEIEAKYINYHLNKRSFINSLDLRNKYAHGSHWGTTNDQEHELNYFQMLKIFVCIILKINDEFCRRSRTKLQNEVEDIASSSLN